MTEKKQKQSSMQEFVGEQDETKDEHGRVYRHRKGTCIVPFTREMAFRILKRASLRLWLPKTELPILPKQIGNDCPVARAFLNGMSPKQYQEEKMTKVISDEVVQEESCALYEEEEPQEEECLLYDEKQEVNYNTLSKEEFLRMGWEELQKPEYLWRFVFEQDEDDNLIPVKYMLAHERLLWILKNGKEIPHQVLSKEQQQEANSVKQGTPLWHLFRAMGIGGSDLAKAFGWDEFRSNVSGLFTKTIYKRLHAILVHIGAIAHRMSKVSDAFCTHGHLTEPESRDLAEIFLGAEKVEESGVTVDQPSTKRFKVLRPGFQVSLDMEITYPTPVPVFNKFCQDLETSVIGEIKSLIYKPSLSRHVFHHFSKPKISHLLQMCYQCYVTNSPFAEYVVYWHFSLMAPPIPVDARFWLYQDMKKGRFPVKRVVFRRTSTLESVDQVQWEEVPDDMDKELQERPQWCFAMLNISRCYTSTDAERILHDELWGVHIGLLKETRQKLKDLLASKGELVRHEDIDAVLNAFVETHASTFQEAVEFPPFKYVPQRALVFKVRPTKEQIAAYRAKGFTDPDACPQNEQGEVEGDVLIEFWDGWDAPVQELTLKEFSKQ